MKRSLCWPLPMTKSPQMANGLKFKTTDILQSIIVESVGMTMVTSARTLWLLKTPQHLILRQLHAPTVQTSFAQQIHSPCKAVPQAAELLSSATWGDMPCNKLAASCASHRCLCKSAVVAAHHSLWLRNVLTLSAFQPATGESKSFMRG